MTRHHEGTRAPKRKGVRIRPKDRSQKTRHPGIKRLADGSFYIRARTTDPKTGKRVEQEVTRGGINVEQALAIQQRMRDELVRHQPKAAPVKIGECAKRWIERCDAAGEAASTLERKAYTLEGHILPILGDVFAQRLDRNDIKDWIAVVSAKRQSNGVHYGEETVRGWWRVLRSFIWFVVDELELEFDPTSGIDVRRYLDKRLRRGVQAEKGTNALTADELGRFLEVAKRLYPQHYALLVVGFFTGMRWSELSALRWQHFDHDTHEIRIQVSQVRGVERQRTKSGYSRSAAYDQSMWQALTEHRQRMMREQAPGFDSGFVFPSRTGGFRSGSSLTKPFARICEQAGIAKQLSTKVFRRTYNDLLRQASVDEMVKLTMVGHRGQRVNERYSTVDPAEKREALAKVRMLVGAGE